LPKFAAEEFTEFEIFRGPIERRIDCERTIAGDAGQSGLQLKCAASKCRTVDRISGQIHIESRGCAENGREML
jgi:hypothetical protein